MSLTLYLDDCAFSHLLRRLLIEAGHDVQVPADLDPPLTGAADAVHFAYAKANDRVILTFNPRDFLDLHEEDSNHPGILTVYQDNDPTKDMSYREMVKAISNLESTDVTITGEFWSLNAYRW